MNPMKTAPRDGSYVMLFIKSGYSGTPLRVEVAQYTPRYRPKQPWVNHAGDSIYDAGGNANDVVGWLPVPEYREPPLNNCLFCRGAASAKGMDFMTLKRHFDECPERGDS
jgi:hypothetical protein